MNECHGRKWSVAKRPGQHAREVVRTRTKLHRDPGIYISKIHSGRTLQELLLSLKPDWRTTQGVPPTLLFAPGEADTLHMTTRSKKTPYVCKECGHTTPKWVGQCTRCEAWNSVEEAVATAPVGPPRSTGGTRRIGSSMPMANLLRPIALSDIDITTRSRIATGITELDRVLGGGFVPGSTVLLAGDPGIGKSTLLLQCAAGVAASTGPVIYATGEESQDQIKIRAERLGVAQERLLVVATGDVASLGVLADEAKPALLVVDSVQTAWHSGIDGAPGTVGQVRQSAAALGEIARRTGVPVVLTGHVTKDGAVAGPKVLEHVVDVVLQLEGSTGTPIRLLRGSKNRHGATDELGVFEMTTTGLRDVAEPSAMFLSQRQKGASGSAVATVIEGTRPITVEVQALVTPTQATSPRRTANGYDLARLHLLVAVISKRLNFPLGSNDVVVNIAGGLKISEPAADLAVALAIVSSFMDLPVREGWSASGEIGLGGELRAVQLAARRASEVQRLGFERCLLPSGCTGLGDSKSTVVLSESLADAVRAAIPIPASRSSAGN